MSTLTIDGKNLTLEDLRPLLAGEGVELRIDPERLPAIRRSRELVERSVEAGAVVYGLTTGFGKLKSVAVDRHDLVRLQRNLIVSHCVGAGPPMPLHEVRIAQVLRLSGLVVGHSGVRPETLEQMARLFNKGFVPEVPQKGSVGASGDLAPLAHMAATYIGFGHAYVGGERMTAADALRRVGEEPLELHAKEGLALINGTEVMKATGAATWLRAAELSKVADILASQTIEALRGSSKPFDPRLAELKHHAGHARTSRNVLRCLADSQILESHKACDRVQDPYSLRCVPQVHGAFKQALDHVGEVLGGEILAVTDNPLLFPETGEVISAGQFHGQPVSMALDYLALSLATLANISERRIEQLVNPDLSNLPAFLTPAPGLNSGLMIAQVAAAALASENKSLAHPASVDTVPTSANQEDHVSMGVTAARKAREICDNVEAVLAIEWVAGAQGLELGEPLPAGRGVEAARASLRRRVDPLHEDRYLYDDLAAARELLRHGGLLPAVEEALGGPLEA